MSILSLAYASSNASSPIGVSKLTIEDDLPSTVIREIIQDKDQRIWIATASGLANFDGYNIKNIYSANNKSLGDIWDLSIDANGSVFIASKTNGMYKYQKGILTKLNLFNDNHEITAIHTLNNDLWVGSNEGIYKIHNNKIIIILKLKNNKPYKFINYDKNSIIAVTERNILKINILSNSVEILKVQSKKTGTNYQLHKDLNDAIWLGRDDGLYLYQKECNCFKNTELIKSSVYSLTSSEKFLWIGSLYDGLFRYNYKTKEIHHYPHKPNINSGFTDNSIFSLFIDHSNVLWLGTFYSGVNYINLNSFNFQQLPITASNNSCGKYEAINDILISKSKALWLATQTGLIKIANNTCLIYKKNNLENSLTSNEIISLYQDKNSNIWITNAEGGLDKFNPKTNLISQKGKGFMNISFYFATEYKDNMLLLGSFKRGLFSYNIKNEQLSHINLQNNNSDLSIYHFVIDTFGNYYFATNKGIAQLKNDVFELLNLNSNNNQIQFVTALAIDQQNNLWFGTNDQKLFKLDYNGNIEKINHFLSETQLNIEINSIISTENDILWLATNKGLIKYNTKTNKRLFYTEKDGVMNGGFINNSYWYDNNRGTLYLGGKLGALQFKPSDIKVNKSKPNIELTEFIYFNKTFDFNKNNQVKLDKPINHMKEIELSYKDYIIGFEFAALDYTDSMRNRYAYRLKGFQDDWVYTDAENRIATYTNLSPEEYIFQVKGSNKDGVWSKTPKELKIIVHPAPWFSPWAYAVYIFLILFSIWSFIRYKTIASRKRAFILEQTVDERTQEVKRQKKMVESLLEHKNEVFANITHEFQTPLALILGPVEQLSKQKELIQHSDKLTMIERNAKRLMLMVAQILKLSQAKSDKEVIRESQSVQTILLMLFEVFSPLAKRKNINLVLSNTSDVNVYATTECLEIVVGNLLSNAIKYTNDGGEIFISSNLVNKQVAISIKDSGAGIEEKDLSKIFKRFTRLDTHKNIAGTGIGLSVVKEITEANDGFVKVESTWGKGSTFTVTFPITDIKPQEEMSEVLVDQLVKNTENELIMVKQIPKVNPNKNRVTVLVIEDNLDMQLHIASVLGHRFNCLFSDRGRKGIAIALKKLPDIIICDVMMPAMDGYQVTRILRHDGRTSHIPIVLLTALNTTKSRIKGWRENIDTYMTKPFNADELNAQIDNILIIRKNLQKQTNQAIRCNSALDSLNLSKQDEKFIDKFKDIIGKHYGNEYFQKADLASKMAISERQLQRKLKALIDQNPMEMLRDYRLEKAAMKLKDGYQVGIVSDECGFSSVSYFGSCFKKKYGITPKAYQTLNNNLRDAT